MAALRETPIRFGVQGRLLGIVTLPAQPLPGQPTVIIPNTGLEHRVGPNRLHVQIARALAAAGYASLRFDLAGLGDSDPAPGQAASAQADLKAAADALTARRLGPEFVLIGLCSGAHDAHQFAATDSRVAGALFIDGYAYPTRKFRLLRVWRRLCEPDKVWRRLLGRRPPATAPAGVSVDLFRYPPQAEAGADYRRMLERGVRLAFVYTGDVEYEYAYRDQLLDAFPLLRGYAKLWYLPHSDHTLTRRRTREELIALARDWLGGVQA
jgi:pimeloyl-ACP methyl ester carboxylesterase